MDFNLKALGAETVMVDRRIVAQLAEAELLLRDGEKLPYQFIRQNSFIGVNPSERLFAKRAVTGKNAECIGVMVKPREIVLAEEVYYRVQELETAESIEKIVGSFSKKKPGISGASVTVGSSEKQAGRKIQSSRKSRYPTRSAAQGRA